MAALERPQFEYVKSGNSSQEVYCPDDTRVLEQTCVASITLKGSRQHRTPLAAEDLQSVFCMGGDSYVFVKIWTCLFDRIRRHRDKAFDEGRSELLQERGREFFAQSCRDLVCDGAGETVRNAGG